MRAILPLALHWSREKQCLHKPHPATPPVLDYSVCWIAACLLTRLLCDPLAKLCLGVAGMKFFPGYVNDARRQLLDAAAFRWHQTGQQQKKLMKWGDRSQLQGGMLMLEAPTPPSIAQKGKQGRPRQELLPSSASLPVGSTQHGGGVAALVSGSCTAGRHAAHVYTPYP